MALAVYIPFPEDDSNSTNHDLVSTQPPSFSWPFDPFAVYDPAPSQRLKGIAWETGGGVTIWL